MRAFLFPGQGIDLVQAVRSWQGRAGPVRDLLDLAAAAGGVARADFLARGGRALARTKILQPVTTALSLGLALELIERGVEPGVVAGHSLGEVAALAVAGALTAEGAIELSAIRGRAMAREAARHPGGMAACHAPASKVREAIRSAGADGVVIAGFNAREQTTVSGEASRLRVLASAIPLTHLPVAGAWHSPAMAGAVAEVRNAARRLVTGNLAVPWIANRQGRVARSAEGVPDLIAGQLVRPVRWVRSMETLRGLGVTEVIALGSRALGALARDELGPSVALRTLTRPARLESLCAVGSK